MYVKNLSFRYLFSDKYVFKDASFYCDKGITAITGSNSSGKTTLLRILSGAIPQLYRGELSVETDSKTDGVFIHQDNNIALMYENVDDEVDFFTQVDDFMFKKKEDFFEKWNIYNISGKKSSELSSGEKQRYSICLSLSFRNNGFVVMDEPFAYLDEKTTDEIIEFIKTFKDSKILILTHYFSKIDKLADTLYTIDNLKIIESKKKPEESFFSFSSSLKGKKLLSVRNLKNINISSTINCDICEGEIKIIYGPNGSGKSTFMRIIAGYEKNYEGVIEFHSISHSDIFYIPPNPDTRIFFHRVGDFFKGKTLKTDILSKLNLQSAFDLAVSHLSYGEKQKLLLAVAVVSGKKIIMIDEPLMSFDCENAKAVSEVINDFVYHGGSVIISMPSKRFNGKCCDVIEL